MITLPIADRELRIAARARRTYRSRLGAAGLAVLLFLGIFFMGPLRFSLAPAGRGIFDALSTAGFVYSLFAGLVLTADSISAEKRDGTLGLLFLSTLEPHQIVFGNLLATSLKGFYGLVAALPILAVSLILGGVQYDEFGRVCLALISTLLFSLIFSMVISSISERHWISTGRALAGLIILAFAVPGTCAGLRRILPLQYRGGGWIMVLDSFSPLTTLRMASGNPGISRRHDYWWSILALNLLTVSLLGLCCYILPRVWQDREAGGSRGSGKEKFWRWKSRNSASRRNLRTRLLRSNPFYWLMVRSRRASLKSVAIILGLAAIAEGVAKYYLTPTIGGKFPAFAAHLAAWGTLVAGLHLILLWQATFSASQRLSEDRKSGALELLLVTPLTVGQIMRGQWRGYLAQLVPSGVALVLLDILVVWATLVMWGMDNDMPGGASRVLLEMYPDLHSGQGNVSSEIYPVLTAILGGGSLFFLHCLAVGCVGVWIGLTNKRPSMAPWITGALVLAVPLPLYFAVLILAGWAGASLNLIFWMWFCVISGLALGTLNDLIFIIWSSYNAATHFRAAAAGEFRAKTRNQRVAVIPGIALRCGYGLALFAGVIALFYTEEKWRGLRAWRQLERQYASHGEKLETRWSRPAPGPVERNFGAAPIFAPLFEYTRQSGRIIWKDPDAHEQLTTLSVTGRPKSFWQKTSDEPFSDWQLQKPVDLLAWRQYYTTNYFPVGSETNGNATAVLNALTVFDSELRELEEYGTRPFSNFPIHYEDGRQAYFPHWSVLANCAEILQLRATAKMEIGDSAGSCADIALSFRLAESIKGEPGLHSREAKHIMLLGTLQPIWEGLRKHRWSEPQLKRFEFLLNTNLLAEYRTGVRSEMRILANTWEALVPDNDFRSTQVDPGLRAASKFYPLGWKYLNQSRLIQFGDERLVPVIDPDSRRAFPSKQKGLARAFGNCGVFVDPVFHSILNEAPISSFIEAAPRFAHAQASLDEARVACALERYRQKYLSYPARLSDLISEHLCDLPVDPIGGGAYKYFRKSPNEFILYSIGWNEVDDGGGTVSSRNIIMQMAGRPSVPRQNIREGDWVWKYDP